MFHVCFQCGQWAPEKHIDPSGPFAICPACQYAHPFKQLPLFVLTGASSAGKSTVCQHLAGNSPDVVVLDGDIVLMEGVQFDKAWNGFFDLWLRMVLNIGQSGRPVLLCGAGLGVPDNLESRGGASLFQPDSLFGLGLS